MRKKIDKSKKHCEKSELCAIHNSRGITLTTLVITIIVLLILAGVATYSGLEAIDNTKRTKFIAELKIMQSYVNKWYEDCKPSVNSANYDTDFTTNITNKFTANGVNAKLATDSTISSQSSIALGAASVPSANYGRFYLLGENQKAALGIEGVSQDVLVSVQDRKVVSYLGLKYKGNMYYTIDSLDGENGIDAIYNVEYDESILKPDESRPEITVTGRSVYFGDTAQNAKYKFTVAVNQVSDHINKGALYYGKKENGSVRNWTRSEDNTFQVDRDGTYQIYYKDAAGNESYPVDYVIEPKTTLVAGSIINVYMKQLSGQTNANYATTNSTITSFRIANQKPSSDFLKNETLVKNIAASGSQAPVYIWYDNGTIWYYSDDNWIFMNVDSSNMFIKCTSIETIELNYFDTSKIKNLTNFFCDCSSLKQLNLNTFDTTKVTNMSCMFIGCSNIEKLNLDSFDTSNVTYMEYMFAGCCKLKELNINHFDTSNVTTMYRIFKDCNVLEELDISNWNTENVKFMSEMFINCKKLKELDLSNFNTSNVANMSCMFQNCNNINNLNVSHFDTSNVTNMSCMFYNCNNIKTLDLSNFDTRNVTNMNSIFIGCTLLEDLDVSNFNTSKVTNMSYMFAGCNNLTRIDISSFNTNLVTTMEKMFNLCNNLTTIYVSDTFVTTQVDNSSQMFYQCNKLKGGNGTIFNSSYTDKTYARIDYIDTDHPENSTPGYFTRKPNI